MTQSRFRVVFAVYSGMTHLDFTGPHQFLSRLPDSETIVASSGGGTVVSEGLTFAGLSSLAEIEGCDLLCVPGGMNAIEMGLDEAFISQVRRLGQGARYITSVCTGSLILGAAGLLEGKRAACHWIWRRYLPLFGAIEDDGRVVRDGHVITGGGVTAGIDFALTVLAEVAGEKVAKLVQLGLEYAPEPPFAGGRPELADADVLAEYRERMRPVLAAREALLQERTVSR